MSFNPPCVKCELTDNSNGLFTCNECRRSFCSNHIVDHSNELRNRLEYIINEYNLIHDIFRDYKQHSDECQWNIIEKEINKIKCEIDEKQKISNYSEKSLEEWTIRLEKLKIQLTKPNESHSSEWKFKPFIIYISFIVFILILYYLNSLLMQKILISNTIFTDIQGSIQLSENQQSAEHNGPDFHSSSLRINQIYATDVHHVQLVLERFSSSGTFIGIIESKSKQTITAAHGWSINNKQIFSYQPGEYPLYYLFKKLWSWIMNDQSRQDVQQGDRIDLVIDCINSKIMLENKRTNVKYQLDVDQGQTSLPWQIIIQLDHHGDRVRLR